MHGHGHTGSQAAEELHGIIMNFEMRFAVLLIFANKIDLPLSLSVEELSTEVRSEATTMCMCMLSVEEVTSEVRWEAMVDVI